MIAAIVTLQIVEGKEAAFEAEYRIAAEQVRAHEAGNRLYQLTRSRTAPQTYRMMELYADEAALEAHGNAPYMPASFERVKPLLAAEPVIELLDTIG